MDLIMIPAYVNSASLLLISLLHFYWAMGGQWGFRAALPERNGTKAFQPGRFMTLSVSVIFGCMSLLYLNKAGVFTTLSSLVPDWLSQYGLWLLAVLFLIRAIGDFRYVGFFKRLTNSRFAELDTKFYSPLCLLLSLNTLLLIAFPVQS
ncbi:DUF3995 domain-containing protein [Spirosoma gilvum]